MAYKIKIWLCLVQLQVLMVNAIPRHGSYVMDIDDQFDSVRGDNPYLVEFYAPWCGHCKKLEPEYEKVGAKLDGTGIYIAKADATLMTRLAEKYKIRGFPTILYIQKDRIVTFRGERTAEDISRFAIRCRSAPISPLYNIGGLRDRLNKQTQDSLFVYVGDQHHHVYNEYREVANNFSVEIDFYYADHSAMKEELPASVNLPLVFVYKDGRRYQFNPLQDSSLTDWVNEERFIAIQPAKGALYYDLMELDKMLVIIVAQENSKDRLVAKHSKRAVDGAKYISLDRNLRQFQFVVMTSPQTVSSIVLGAVPVPYAIAFHPKTHIYYELQKPVQEMDTADWIDFVTGIITEKSQGLGGRGYFRHLQRALYGFATSTLELWSESRVLFIVVVVIPMFVICLVIYTLCCISWGEETDEMEDISDAGEDEGEAGEDEELPDTQSDEKSGHLKTE